MGSPHGNSSDALAGDELVHLPCPCPMSCRVLYLVFVFVYVFCAVRVRVACVFTEVGPSSRLLV